MSALDSGQLELGPAFERGSWDEVAAADLDARDSLLAAGLEVAVSGLVGGVLRDPKPFGGLLDPDEVSGSCVLHGGSHLCDKTGVPQPVVPGPVPSYTGREGYRIGRVAGRRVRIGEMNQTPGVAETALVIEIPEAEHLVRSWRAEHDPAATQGMPAHITVLYPFAPPGQLDIEGSLALKQLASSVKPFDFELTAVDEFPGVVWLRPRPDDPFRELTRLLWRAFPDYPPYGGRYPDSQPHLTLAVVPDGEEQALLANEIRDDLERQLPIPASAAWLSVFTRPSAGHWERAKSLPFGGTLYSVRLSEPNQRQQDPP